MKRGTKLTTGLLLIVTLSGCFGATGANEGCAGWKPIRLAPSTIDALTDQDAREILGHNTFGRSQG